MIKINLVNDEKFIWDEEKFPHILIEGTNYSGKTVAQRSIRKDMMELGYIVAGCSFSMGWQDLLKRGENEENEKVFFFLDIPYQYQQKAMEKFTKILRKGKSINVHFIISMHKAPESIKENCGIQFISTLIVGEESTFEFKVNENEEEKNVRFPFLINW